jgi:hypothetical protein
MTQVAPTVWGELFRIGDIIQQEEPGFYSRKVCTLAKSQTIKKGQVLGGDPELGTVFVLPAGVDDAQVLTEQDGTDGGTFYLTYKGRLSASVAWNVSASDLQAAIRAIKDEYGNDHPDLAAVTVAGNAGGPYTITNPKASVPVGGQPVFEVVDDLTVDGGVLEGGIVLTHTGVGVCLGAGATCIALEAKTTTSATANIRCLVRHAMVKPGFLTYGANVSTTAAAIATANKSLESRSGIVVLSGPTYGQSQDATLSSEETLTTPSNDYAEMGK